MCLPIFLDADPGIDGAVAIVATTSIPELGLQLMITAAGNVSVEKTTRSALQLLHLWNAEIPLVQGTAVPLVCIPRDAASIHSESRVAGCDLVEHNRQPLDIPASLAIRGALTCVPEPATPMTIGLLINIALLLSRCPECEPYIRCLVIMGGSVGRGNCTPNAEFNIATDPGTAAHAFHSGIEVVMRGLDVTNQAILIPNYLAVLPELNRAGKVLHALFSHYRSGSMQSGLCMYDLCTIVWLVHPELFTLKPCFIAVETQGEFTSGTTVADIDGCLGKPANVQVALDLDVKGFQQWVVEMLAPTL